MQTSTNGQFQSTVQNYVTKRLTSIANSAPSSSYLVSSPYSIPDYDFDKFNGIDTFLERIGLVQRSYTSDKRNGRTTRVTNRAVMVSGKPFVTGFHIRLLVDSMTTVLREGKVLVKEDFSDDKVSYEALVNIGMLDKTRKSVGRRGRVFIDEYVPTLYGAQQAAGLL